MMRSKCITMALTIVLAFVAGNLRAQDVVRLGDDLLRFGGNLSFITSKTYIYDGERGMNGYSWRPGVSFLAEYEHIWPSGWGLGTMMDFNHTVYDGNIYKSSYNVNLFYWGVGGLYRNRLGGKWMYEVGLGLGWANVSGDVDEESNGLGLMEKIGVEYQLSPIVGLNIQLIDIQSLFPKSKEFKELGRQYPDEFDTSYGFYRLELSVGITVHL